MARAENDTVIAVFDNFSAELGLPAPTLRFNEDPITGGNATAGTAYSGTLAGSATDPEEDPLTYSKTAGPAWLTVAGDGTLSGTPSEADAGVNQFTVVVLHPDSTQSSVGGRSTKAPAMWLPTSAETVVMQLSFASKMVALEMTVGLGSKIRSAAWCLASMAMTAPERMPS
jgi:hypothetical protein